MKKFRLRHPRTTQERRYNCYMKYPETEDTLYRAKRSWKSLPEALDDLWVYERESWKDRKGKRKGKRKKQFRQNKREFKEICFNGTSWEQYSDFFDGLINKGVYFKVFCGWWSLPAIDRMYYIYWWE